MTAKRREAEEPRTAPAGRTPSTPPSPAISSPSPRLRGHVLAVPPFRIELHGQAFASEVETEIDVSLLGDGVYRIVAVHNFHAEDRNPNLDECLAAVFLAGRRPDGSWEEPERFPVECRALRVLGALEVAGGRAALLEPPP